MNEITTATRNVRITRIAFFVACFAFVAGTVSALFEGITDLSPLIGLFVILIGATSLAWKTTRTTLAALTADADNA